ncbi:AIR carboxylase family protein [Candidatus Bathyarchaeota archaeon]|nr:AIR carboxylase family protein [Candidatus Bathyarchaeota archaeon]
MVDEKIIIIMGSKKDEEFSNLICTCLNKLSVTYERRVASAHKTPQKLLKIIEEYEEMENRIVYITIAGGSNSLSGFVDANTKYPVIACPPHSNKFGHLDIYSSLRMPSGVSPLVILDPENAALAVAKILALTNPELSNRALDYQQNMKAIVERADKKLRNV